MSLDLLRSGRNRLQWAKIDANNPAQLHRPKKQGDVGWDLECAERTVIEPLEAKDVPTNVKIALPSGTWAEIRARSSIVRMGLVVEAGVIDNGYRGPLFALVRNMNLLRGPLAGLDKPVVIEEGQRIAQVVFNRITPIWDVEIDEMAANTERGESGFGSTGL